jgi:hypothetical protein
MKISRSHSPQQVGAGAKAAGASAAKGKGFAAKLESAARAQKPAIERAEPPATERVSAIGNLAADLKAGRTSLDAVIDKLVEHVLDNQLGKKANAALRAEVGQALRDTLANDPLLAAKVKSLETD